MAIVKTSYTRNRQAAKATIRYMIHRPGLAHTPIRRQLVGFDGIVEMHEAYEMIDEAGKGTHFYRIILNFDPKTEDTNKDLRLQEIIEKTMLHLEEHFQRELQFVAVEHNDHSPLRHAHMLALLPGKLNVKDLAALRSLVTEAAVSQRQDLDLAHTAMQQGRGVAPGRPTARTPEPQRNSHAPEGKVNTTREEKPLRSRVKPLPNYQVCHLCGKPSGKKAMRCYNCGARLAISLDLGDNGLGNDWDL